MSNHIPTRSALSVLVVDDYPDAAESEADLLSLLGHAVRVSLSGADALRCVDEERPDVVLLDIRMPEADGFEVAQAIRDRCAGGKQPLIVAVTGCDSGRDRLRCAEAGFDQYLVKPVPPSRLTAVLERFRSLLSPPVPVNSLGSGAAFEPFSPLPPPRLPTGRAPEEANGSGTPPQPPRAELGDLTCHLPAAPRRASRR